MDWKGLLIVITAIGIHCQFDESAYGYQNTGGRWQRVWESERNDYWADHYDPQFSDSVQTWQARGPNGTGPLYVMTLGNLWGCASTWHDVTYRVWRIDPAGPTSLIDHSEWAWLRAGEFTAGSIGQGRDEKSADVLVEFTEDSLDGSVHNREAVRHFEIDGDRITRIDPAALSPRDFVDEWLTRPSEETIAWSASRGVQRAFSKLHPDE